MKFERSVAWAVLILVGSSVTTNGFAQGVGEDCANPENFAPAPAELTQILEAHQAWIADPSSGAPADLCNLTLKSADFQDASLSNAILRKSFAERARFL